jgi:hypothetical protein
MRHLRIPLALLGAAACALLSFAALPIAHAQTLKGANWLRTNHGYGSIPANDPGRIGWNLEIAKDMPTLAGQPANYRTLHAQYGIRTLARLAFDIKPSYSENIALNGTVFDCSSIGNLMNRIDAEAAQIASSEALGAFILANEPNLGNEWAASGKAYGRVYKCYRQRWTSNPHHAGRPLLASGPGGCGGNALAGCHAFFNFMTNEMGPVVDGFSIHAYGSTGPAFAGELGWQLNAINQAANVAARGKPVYVTEFNAGAVPWGPLPTPPTLDYFNAVIDAVRNVNGSGQIKALLYFVDSPDSWIRGGESCHPASTPPSREWTQSSLCYNGNWRNDWMNARGSGTSLDAAISLSRMPAFMMPGQIQRFDADARNAGSTLWDGGGQSSWYRLGAHTGNGFMFSHMPQCGGYANSTADARVYTCDPVSPGAVRQYRVQARAPIVASNATYSVRMVRDGVTWFGTSAQQNVMVGQTACGSALTQCILRMRTDVLPFYQANGWDTSCSNRNAIVNNWCGQVDSDGSCAALKAGTCATYNSTVRCPAFTQIGGAAIARSDTFPGYKVCSTDLRMHTCDATGVWVASTTPCK